MAGEIKNQKHILIHSIVFPPDGVSTAYLYGDIAENLQQKGCKVTVLTSTPHYNPPKDEFKMKKKVGGIFYESEFRGIRILHIPQSKPHSTIKRLFQFIKFHVVAIFVGLSLPKYHVVLAPSPPLTMGLIAVILAKFKGAKAVYNVQEIYPDLAIKEGTLGNPFLIKLLKGMERFIYNGCAKVVTIDPFFSDVIRERVKDQRKLMAIPNFIDTELYRPELRNNAFSEKHNLDKDFVVGYVGNIGAYQDWEIVIDAAEMLKAEPIRFLIVGDGVKKEWIKKTIKERSLHNVLVLDYQDRKNIPLVNATADIHTVTMTETSDLNGLPSKIFAIMASGRSLIAATDKTSAISRIIGEAGCGQRVDVGDAIAYANVIKAAMNDREALVKEGMNGRAFVENGYSKEVVTNRYFEVLTNEL